MRFRALAATLAAAVGVSMLQSLPASAAEPDPGPATSKIASNLKDRFRTQPSSDFWITFETGATTACTTEYISTRPVSWLLPGQPILAGQGMVGAPDSCATMSRARVSHFA